MRKMAALLSLITVVGVMPGAALAADLKQAVEQLARAAGVTLAELPSPAAVEGTAAEAEEAKPPVLSLAGKVYSRTFTSRPFGHPGEPRPFTHSLKFGQDGTVVDNGSSFFGNPPVRYQYEVRGTMILVHVPRGRTVGAEAYTNVYDLSADGTTLTLRIPGGSQVLTLQN